MNFNPNMMSLNDMAKISPMGNTAMGIYGSALSPEMQSQMMPMGMMNRDGQEMMGQQNSQAMTQPQGMNQMDMYRMAASALQGLGRSQQPAQMPQLPIMRDTNQFRFAGMQQNPQMLAQALRNRG
jgi:hypothetical protein